MRRLVALLTTLAMCASVLIALAGVTVWAEESEALAVEGIDGDINNYLWEIPEGASVEEQFKLEKRNFKIIQSLVPFFTEDSYRTYSKAVTKMKSHSDEQEYIDTAIAAREKLVQIDEIEDRVWEIWDDTVALKDGESFTEEDEDSSSMDGYGFKPFIITYILEDQSQVKGNIIAVSGGAMKVRSNEAEGYPAAVDFNAMGYNVFLLQRRVWPYSSEDIYMDFQRAVRVVRYHVENDGLGGADMIAGVGWSGGGGTINGATKNCYGYLTPADTYDTDYVPDEIDAINSDLDVQMIIYSGGAYTTDNPHIPATYMCVGTEDETGAYPRAVQMYEQLKDIVPMEILVVEGAVHGFGMGHPDDPKYTPGMEQWPIQADAFMQAHKGFSTSHTNDPVVAPEESETLADSSY